jgi:nitroreductase
MEFRIAINSRRSVRSFTPEPVTQEDIASLIEAAIQAPSAVNEQPWHFTVVRDGNLLDEISRKAKVHMLARMLGDAKETHVNPYVDASQHLRHMLESPDFQIFYHAPALIIISAIAADEWAVENCALAAENLMLTACSMGLGSCWIGFAQRWLSSDEGKARLGIPADYVPVAPLIIGHPREPVAAVRRQKPRIHWVD